MLVSHTGGDNLYKRILLKLSGEALSGEGERGFDREMIGHLISELKPVLDLEVKVGLVVGAGNLFRGKDLNVDPIVADGIGMLGTVINSLYVHAAFKEAGIPSVVFSQIVSLPSTESLRYHAIEKALKAGKVAIFSGGTSNPLFTTDSAAALRAMEMRAEVILKATKVDGVYDADPKTSAGAKRYERLTFDEALQKNLKVMDMEAFSLCRRYRIPVIVFNFFQSGNLLRAVKGESIGTLVTPE